MSLYDRLRQLGISMATAREICEAAGPELATKALREIEAEAQGGSISVTVNLPLLMLPEHRQ